MSSEPDNKALLQQLRIDRSEPPANTGVSRRYWIIGAALLLAIIGAGAWWVLAGPRGVPVHTALARAVPGGGTGGSVLDATGYVTARREATVSAQITGTLTQVLIEEGDHVKEGQVLGTLDDTAQKAALAQAQAQLHTAQSLLAQYQVQLAQSVRDANRAEDLVKRNLVSAQAVEQARAQVDGQSAQVEGQRKQIDLATANLRSAQVQLDYCTVRAPFTGVVIAKAAQVGEIISPFSAGGGFTRTGIGTIVDMDSLEIEVDVNEAYINRVQPGQPVQSVLNAYPDWQIPSHVIAIIPTADRSKATVKVRIGLDAEGSAHRPGHGRARLLPGGEEDRSAGRRAGAARGARADGRHPHARRSRRRLPAAREAGRAAHRDPRWHHAATRARYSAASASGIAVILDPPADLKDGAAVTEAK